MKIRSGFVSNSSSSSFAINIKTIPAKDLQDILCKYIDSVGEYKFKFLPVSKSCTATRLYVDDTLEKVIKDLGLEHLIFDADVHSDFYDRVVKANEGSY